MSFILEIVPCGYVHAGSKVLLVSQIAELLAEHLGVFSVCLGWQYQIPAADHDGAVFLCGRVAINNKSVRFYVSHSFSSVVKENLTARLYRFISSKFFNFSLTNLYVTPTLHALHVLQLLWQSINWLEHLSRPNSNILSSFFVIGLSLISFFCRAVISSHLTRFNIHF
jgi:hypothetical protein